MICKDTPTYGWVCGWFGGSVGQWVGSGLMTNNGINLDLIEIIQFCLKIYDLKETPPPMGGCMDSCVDEWFSGSMGGVRSYCLISNKS